MNKRRYKLKQEPLLVNLFIVVQYCLYIMFLKNGNGYIRTASMLLGIFGICFCLFCSEHFRVKRVLYEIVFIAVIMSINIFFWRTYSISNVFYEVLVYFGMACILLRKSVNRKVCLALFYAIAGYLFIQYLSTGGMRFFLGVSENSISIVLIVSLFPYFSTFKNKEETPSILPVIVCFFLCVLSIGRGGIIMGALLMLLLCVKTIFDNKHASGLNILLCVLSLCSILFVLFFTDILAPFLYKFASFSDAFSDRARYNIWSEYLSCSFEKLKYFLFGFPTYASSIISGFKNNVHNSFLETHLLMGVWGIWKLFVGGTKGIIYIYRTQKWSLVIFMIVFFMRSFTDWVFPLQMGSIVIYYLIMLPIIEPAQNE